MPVNVLVRSTLRQWDLILTIIVGLLATGIGVMWMGNRLHIPGAIVATVGVLCAMGGVIALWRRIALRQWVAVTDDGFVLVDQRGETEFEDSQVQSLALDFKRNHSRGIHQSTTRTVILWLEERQGNKDLRRLEFRTTFKANEPDPLSELIARLGRQVLRHARDLLAEGRTFSGDGWQVSGQHLVFTSGTTPVECPIDEIVMAAIVDGELRLWRRNQEEVWARTKIGGVNAYLLKELLDQRPADDPEWDDCDSDKLGRVIFERKSAVRTKVLLALGLLPLFLMALASGVAIIDGGVDRLPGLIMGVLVLLASITCILRLVHCSRFVFRCHELGVFRRGLLEERKLRYEHVEAFTFHTGTSEINGLYAGTTFFLDFEPDAEHKSQRITHSVLMNQADESLERLRDAVATVVGERMRRDVEAGRQVQWTPALLFDLGNLHYTPSGLLGRKATVEIPVVQIASFVIEHGQCALFREGESQAVVIESVNSRNFFPGLYCLRRLIDGAHAVQVAEKRGHVGKRGQD